MNHNDNRVEPEKKNKHGRRIQQGKEQKEKILNYNIYEGRTKLSISLKSRGRILVSTSTVGYGHYGKMLYSPPNDKAALRVLWY